MDALYRRASRVAGFGLPGVRSGPARIFCGRTTSDVRRCPHDSTRTVFCVYFRRASLVLCWTNNSASRTAPLAAFLFLGLTPLPFGVMTLFGAAVLLVTLHVGIAVRLAGFAFWLLFGPMLSAERLRVWPFKSI